MTNGMQIVGEAIQNFLMNMNIQNVKKNKLKKHLFMPLHLGISFGIHEYLDSLIVVGWKYN
jgi:hypothetical protein